LLPTLSRLSVSYCPAGRLRHRSSSGSLRIPPLHPVFYLPLQYSSLAVSTADPGLSPGLSPQTYKATYAPFTPSDSGQRSHPPYYRGCWHGVSRCFLTRYRQVGKIRHSSRATEVYTPRSFIPHAASLRQPLGHCARFPTAASRRSLGRFSVPMWLAILSDQLPVVALVSRYLANKLIGRKPLSTPITGFIPEVCPSRITCGITRPLGRLCPTSR
jgi:hypothetical protein